MARKGKLKPAEKLLLDALQNNAPNSDFKRAIVKKIQQRKKLTPNQLFWACALAAKVNQKRDRVEMKKDPFFKKLKNGYMGIHYKNFWGKKSIAPGKTFPSKLGRNIKSNQLP